LIDSACGGGGTGLDSIQTWAIVFNAIKVFAADSTIALADLIFKVDSAIAADTIPTHVATLNYRVAQQIADTVLADTIFAPTLDDARTYILGGDSSEIDTGQVGKWMVNNLGKDSSGYGTDLLRIYAVDTMRSDSAVPGVNVGVYYYAGQQYAAATTNSAGYIDIYLSAPDSYVVQAGKAGYIWGRKQIVVDSSEIDSIFGTNVVIGIPDSANVCRVYGYMQNISASLREGVKIVASLSVTSNVVDSCTGVGLDAYEQTTTTNSAGYWSMDLVKTKCIDPASTYTFKGYYPAGRQIVNRIKVTVPDSDQYKLW
jgi:hypothetical protein